MLPPSASFPQQGNARQEGAGGPASEAAGENHQARFALSPAQIVQGLK